MTSILLIGGGHAHLYFIKQWMTDPSKRYQITLVSPSRFQYYSGMFSGFSEGLYSLEDIRIDLKALCQKAKINFIQDQAERLDAPTKRLFLKNGSVLSFDVASFDIGSLTDIPDYIHHGLDIKPNFRFPEIIDTVRNSEQPVIIGGGASGIELGLSLQAFRNKKGIDAPITIINRSTILRNYSNHISEKLIGIIKKKNIHLLQHCKVVRVGEKEVETSLGKTIPYTSLLWLTGPKSPPIFTVSGLKTDERGFLCVRDTLQACQHPFLFGVGDCISFSPWPQLPKNGVYAIRQAPILWKNVMNYIEQKRLKPFQPQKRFLSILSIGNKEGFLIYPPFASHGRVEWLLKHWIDRNYIQSYQTLYQRF